MVYIPLFGDKMIVIKQIDDKELVQLIELFIVYNQCLITKHNKYISTKILLDRLILEDSKAIGLYVKEKLEGFTLGNALDNDTFHFTDMYVTPRYRIYVKKLLDGSEKFLEGKYKAWTSESHTKAGIKMFEHYGAETIQIKYYKELL